MERCCKSRIAPAGWRYRLLPGVAVLVICTLIFLFSCNTKQGGCLDLEAMNFDVTAEKDDPGSCVYPDLLLNVAYKWGDTTFATGVVYTNNLGQHFIVERFHFLFSQFVINRTDADTLAINEMTEWYVGNGSGGAYFDVTDDFVFVDRSRFLFTLGTISESGFATTYNFWSGVPPSLTPTNLDSIPAESNIQDARALYEPARELFANARFIMYPDTAVDVLDTFVVYTEPIFFTHMLQKTLIQGFDDTLNIGLDLEVMFGDANLKASPEMIVEHLANQLESAVLDNN